MLKVESRKDKRGKMAVVSLDEWRTFLKIFPDVHILQTAEWGELKGSFDWSVARVVVGDLGAQILFRKLPLGFSIAYMPKPVFSNQLSVISDQFWMEVDSVCRQYHAVFLKIEPDAWEGDLAPDTWHVTPDTWNMTLDTSPHNIQPPRTIIVDIRGTEEEILVRMKQKCRYNTRLAEKKGIVVCASSDVENFHRMMLVTGGRDAFGVHSLEYYRKAYELFHPQGMCELLVAEYEGKPLAALMVFAQGKRAYYLYGASTDEERNRMPTYLLQWEAIQWARSKGAEEYDLWGVPDEDETSLESQFERRSDGLWGVYRFKRGFGGEVKRARQAMDSVYNPLLYGLYIKLMASRE
jgi:lipid II:glycine glycyltransferase (peptidoglycan interpeptide bridge formation enzyme)